MTQKKFVNTAFQRAYSAWFSDYERARKQTGRRRGAKIPDFPSPPASPDDIAAHVSVIGRRKVLEVFGIHRTTLSRWLDGSAVIPRPAWLLLVLMSEGRLPGMSEAWRDIRFDGDRLYIIGTRMSYGALEIAGWHYQQQHARALADRVAALEKENAHLLRVGDFGAANDPVIVARAG